MAPPAVRSRVPLTLLIKAVPNASRDEIAGVLDHPAGKRVKIRVSAPPEGGKANKAIVKLLARELGCRPADVEVVAGASNPEKTVAFAAGSVTREALDALLVSNERRG